MSRSAWSSVTLLVMVLALAGCGDSPSAPNRTVTQSLNAAAGAEVSRDGTRRQSFSSIDTTFCGGEPVTMTMVVDFQWHKTILAPDQWMLTQHGRWSIDGVVTTSGARYIGHWTFNDTQVFAALSDPDRAFTFTQVFRVQNVVQGSADNEVMVLHTKWTYNANGQLSVTLVKNVEFECRG